MLISSNFSEVKPHLPKTRMFVDPHTTYYLGLSMCLGFLFMLSPSNSIVYLMAETSGLVSITPESKSRKVKRGHC